MTAAEQSRPRRVRSFVRREGRITVSQARALETLWPRYGVDAPHGGALDLARIFGRVAPVILEIGFGNGDHLLGLAQAQPQHDFIGVEVHRPGVGRLIARADAATVTNLRVICHDAVEVLNDWIGPGALAEILVYFADPWPKKRHHKRRLIQAEFAALLASRLVAGGALRLATDWADYAQHMLATLNAEPRLRNVAADRGFIPRPPQRPTTKFEQRGTRLGHDVFDLEFRRVADVG